MGIVDFPIYVDVRASVAFSEMRDLARAQPAPPNATEKWLPYCEESRYVDGSGMEFFAYAFDDKCNGPGYTILGYVPKKDAVAFASEYSSATPNIIYLTPEQRGYLTGHGGFEPDVVEVSSLISCNTFVDGCKADETIAGLESGLQKMRDTLVFGSVVAGSFLFSAAIIAAAGARWGFAVCAAAELTLLGGLFAVLIAAGVGLVVYLVDSYKEKQNIEAALKSYKNVQKPATSD